MPITHRYLLMFAALSSLTLWAACASPQPKEELPVEEREQATKHTPHKHDHAAHSGHEHEHEHKHHHSFDDVDKWVARFEAPEREAWQKPAEVIAHMDISLGMTVVDLGAGTGYFLPKLVNAVGPAGRVLALDASPKLVEHMNGRVQRQRWTTVKARQIPLDDPHLSPDSIDRILTVDTWHHIEGREAYAKKIAAALKPGGKFIVVEVTAESERKGPPAAMRLSPAQITDELTQAGLKVTMIEESLPEQYILVATKP